MMRLSRLCRALIGGFIVFGLGSFARAGEPGLYGRTIVAPAASGPMLAATVEDAADTLAKITGRDFQITHTSGEQAIVLRLEQPVENNPQASREAFTIRSSGPDQLLIASSSEAGLAYGLYYYLDQLGCRWFFPTEHWTIIPSRQDIRLAIDRTVAPAFRSRMYVGQYGYGPRNPVDPKREVGERWEQWKRRNGYGGEYRFNGHTGELFNTLYKKTLEQHPEYLAMRGGKRQAWSVITKWCVSNPELQKLYVEDRLRALRLQLRKDPDSLAVSVEPADGGGQCECPQCNAIGSGSVSDKVFYLANVVAKAVAKEFPGHYVSLYAYNEHADLPTIDLEPNVVVQVVPYGFQRTNLSGDELLQAWRHKATRMGLYTYWVIPDWHRDRPVLNWMSFPAERIRFWSENGVENVYFETTYAAAPMGMAGFLVGKLLWEPQRDVTPLVNDFFGLFGPAEPPMRRMLQRWAEGFMLTDHELGLSYRNLREARELAGANREVLHRINDFVRYVHFLRLSLEMQTGDSEKAAQSQRELLTWVWRINDSCMVHSARIWKLTTCLWAKNPGMQREFDIAKPELPVWAAAAAPVSDAELVQLLAEGLAQYQPVEFQAREYSPELVARPEAHKLMDEFSPLLTTSGSLVLEFVAPPGMDALPLRVMVRTPAKPDANAADPLVLRSSTGQTIYTSQIPADSQSRDITVPLPGPGQYTLQITDPKRGVIIGVPRGIPLVTRAFLSTNLSPRMYFYVPKGLKEIAMYLPTNAELVKFRDSTGRLLPSENRGLTVVKIPAGQDGSIWSLEDYKAWLPLRAMNVPQVFSLYPDALMFPASLRDEIGDDNGPAR